MLQKWSYLKQWTAGPEENVKRRRKILGERVVANIRFPVMEQKEFAEVVLDCEILTPKEAYDIMKYFNGVLPNPVGFLETKRSGRNSRISMYTALGFGLEDPSQPII